MQDYVLDPHYFQMGQLLSFLGERVLIEHDRQ
jgi:hypothetical protein